MCDALFSFFEFNRFVCVGVLCVFLFTVFGFALVSSVFLRFELLIFAVWDILLFLFCLLLFVFLPAVGVLETCMVWVCTGGGEEGKEEVRYLPSDA